MATTKIKKDGIDDNAVTTAKILDANVSNAKLGTDISAAKLTAGTIDGDRLPSPNLTIKGDTTAGKLILNCETNAHGIGIQSPLHASAASYTLTLPTTDGNADEFLQSNGSGVLSWASAGGGAWNFISSTALDAATISVSGLDSTYDRYQMVLSNVHVDTESSGNQYLWARAIQGGSAITSSDYIYAATSMMSNSTNCNAYSSNGTTYFMIANNGVSLPTAEILDITFDICHPASTTTWLTCMWKKIGYTHDDRLEVNTGGGQLQTTAATTGIQFGLQAGAYDGGTVRLYGLAHS